METVIDVGLFDKFKSDTVKVEEGLTAEEAYKKGLALVEGAAMSDSATLFFSKEEQSKLKQALLYFNKALEMNPQHGEWWAKKGVTLFSLKRVQEALTCVETALKIDPQQAEWWFLRVVIVTQLKEYNAALICCDKAIEINPHYADAWWAKGDTLCTLGNAKKDASFYHKALPCFNRALSINPQHPHAWHMKVATLTKLERWQDLSTCLDGRLEANPNDKDALHLKQMLLADIKDGIIKMPPATEKAPRPAQAAVTKRNTDPIVNQKVLVLLNEERFEEALQTCETALELNSQDVPLWELKASVFFALQRYQEALQSYDTALKFDPNDQTAQKGKEATLEALNKTAR